MAKKKKEIQNENVENESALDKEQRELDESLGLINLCREERTVPFEEAVEKERKNIFVVYKKANRKNTIIMIGMGLVFMASIILFVNFPGWGQITGGVLIGAALIFLVVNFILTKDLFPNTTKKYIKFFLTESDNYIFDIPDVHDQKLYFEKRYKMDDVLSDRVYADAADIVSRNLVSATYKEKPFECGELAIYKARQGRGAKPVSFVGRYLSLENKMHFKDRYIIQIKSAERVVDEPTDIKDLVVLSEQNNFVIYGPEGADYERDLGKELIDNLKSIECIGALVNVNAVFWAGHTAIYMSYDDSVAAIPFDKPIVVESYQQVRNNLRAILEIVAEK